MLVGTLDLDRSARNTSVLMVTVLLVVLVRVVLLLKFYDACRAHTRQRGSLCACLRAGELSLCMQAYHKRA